MKSSKSLNAILLLVSVVLTSAGICAAMASSAWAAKPQRIADDQDEVAIYQNLREVRVQKAKPLNFDADVKRLASLEQRYQEKLPGLEGHERLRKPMERVSQQRYRYRGGNEKRLVRKKRGQEQSRHERRSYRRERTTQS